MARTAPVLQDPRRMTRIFLLLAAGLSVSAQGISLGVKAGSVLKDSSLNESIFSAVESGRWSGGPTVELRLPYRFSLEADALYQSYQRTSSYPLALPTTANGDPVPFIFSSQLHTRSWEVPILLKYHFLNGPWRPFIGGGISWSHEWSEGQSLTTCVGTSAACSPGPFRGGSSSFSTNRKGPTAGAGIDFKTHRVTITPEIRYAHLDQPTGNRVRAIVGFTFGK